MSEVFHIGDLHLGHKKILEFSGDFRGGETPEEHDEWIIAQWNSRVTKRDKVFVHGDVCFSRDKLPLLDRMTGSKILICGNHDKFNASVYLKYFTDVVGFVRYKNHWLSHAPIHPDELRGKRNIHGHVHSTDINDNRYINVSVEANYGIPMEHVELTEQGIVNDDIQ